MTLRTVRRLAAVAAVFALAVVAGCRGGAQVTPIKTLLDDPSHFDHQTVRVVGTVTKAIGVLGYGAYEVNDGSGTLPVVSQGGGAPREGAKVGVEGEFRSAFTLGDRTVAVIVEHQRAVQ